MESIRLELGIQEGIKSLVAIVKCSVCLPCFFLKVGLHILKLNPSLFICAFQYEIIWGKTVHCTAVVHIVVIQKICLALSGHSILLGDHRVLDCIIVKTRIPACLNPARRELNSTGIGWKYVDRLAHLTISRRKNGGEWMLSQQINVYIHFKLWQF